jgi:hypothetical protein
MRNTGTVNNPVQTNLTKTPATGQSGKNGNSPRMMSKGAHKLHAAPKFGQRGIRR